MAKGLEGGPSISDASAFKNTNWEQKDFRSSCSFGYGSRFPQRQFPPNKQHRNQQNKDHLSLPPSIWFGVNFSSFPTSGWRDGVYDQPVGTLHYPEGMQDKISLPCYHLFASLLFKTQQRHLSVIIYSTFSTHRDSGSDPLRTTFLWDLFHPICSPKKIQRLESNSKSREL